MSRRVGVLTEDQAAGFLETQGYTIVARNVAARGGELDIVALDGKVLCFVEVRARASARWGTAAESVGPVKQARLAHAAAKFLTTWRDRDAACRFDVVGVAPGPRFTLIRDAFRV